MMSPPARTQPRAPSPIRLTLTLGALLAGLVVAGPTASAALPLRSPTGIGEWWVSAGPAVALMTFVRAVSLVTLLAIVVLVVLHALADSWSWCRGAARSLTPTAALPLLAAFGVLSSACTSSHDAGWTPLDDSEPRATAVLRPLESQQTTTTAVLPTSSAVEPSVDRVPTSLVPLEDTENTDQGDSVTIDASTADQDLGTGVDSSSVDWVVKPGEHLWSIARWSLEDNWGRPPSDAEIEPYWRAVVQTNRSRLADPNNPDLILPGQELALPPIPTAPEAPLREWNGVDRRQHLR